MHSPSNIRGSRRTLALTAATALALALAACNGPAPEEQDQALDQAQQAAAEAAAPAPDAATPPAGSCDASQVQGLVGQPYSDAVGEQARQDAGAEKVLAHVDTLACATIDPSPLTGPARGVKGPIGRATGDSLTSPSARV